MMRVRAAVVALALAGIVATGIARADDPPIAIKGGTVLTITKGVIPSGTVLIKGGKITAVGSDVAIPADATVIDASGKYVMPGIIDPHSHMGVYPWPDTRGNDDGNEATHPLTPQVRAEDSFFLEDPGIDLARAGGVSTILSIPGSANLAGGLGVVAKLRRGNTLDDIKVAGARRFLKMAFGENPKRVYGEQNRMPSTRMGNAATLRQYFQDAREYVERWKDYDQARSTTHPLTRPERDQRLETLAALMRDEIRVQWHCYRKDDLLTAIRLSEEFKFKIASFHHVLEGYKIASELARRDIGACTWADWWGFKMEAWDGIMENAALMAQAGVRVSIHSDSADGVQRLYHEAAKAVRHGMTEEQGLKAITLWPASILGLDTRIGSLDVGKDADVCVYSRHPFDVYTLVELNLIEGKVVYDREKGVSE